MYGPGTSTLRFTQAAAAATLFAAHAALLRVTVALCKLIVMYHPILSSPQGQAMQV